MKPTNTDTEPEVTAWGIFDTVDKFWIGDDDGPVVFRVGDKLPNGNLIDAAAAECLARLCAMTTNYKLKQPAGRTIAMPFDCPNPILHDIVPVDPEARETLIHMLGSEGK